LLDFLNVAKRECPHAIVLMGPFLDMSHQDISSGELSFENPKDGAKCFITHEELFKDLLSTIKRELSDLNTTVILVPSTKDVHHFEPLPQVPYNISTS
jgi:hypothetical protein